MVRDGCSLLVWMETMAFWPSRFLDVAIFVFFYAQKNAPYTLCAFVSSELLVLLRRNTNQFVPCV